MILAALANALVKKQNRKVNCSERREKYLNISTLDVIIGKMLLLITAQHMKCHKGRAAHGCISMQSVSLLSTQGKLQAS